MSNFDAHEQWDQKHTIPALQNPVSEFNARRGMELEDYQRLQEDLAAQPNLGQEEWAEIKKELPPFELFEDPKTGQNLRIQRFNWPEDGEIGDQKVTLMTRGFYASIDPPHIQYQHYQVAKEVGDPLIVFENPDYGESDDLTQTQKLELRSRGNFGPIAEPMLGIAESMGVKTADVVGYSMGSAIAEELAAHAKDYGIDVNYLFSMENPKDAKQNRLKLGHNLTNDRHSLKFKWDHSPDPVVHRVAKIKYAVPKGVFSYSEALAMGGRQEVLERALNSQPNMRLIMGHAGSSRVQPGKAENQVYEDLVSAYPDRSIRHIVAPGESHAYNNDGERFAHLTKMILKNSVTSYPEASD
jgi:pimeloyl-ACP methyl ester carboxylesterase